MRKVDPVLASRKGAVAALRNRFELPQRYSPPLPHAIRCREIRGSAVISAVVLRHSETSPCVACRLDRQRAAHVRQHTCCQASSEFRSGSCVDFQNVDDKRYRSPRPQMRSLRGRFSFMGLVALEEAKENSKDLNTFRIAIQFAKCAGVPAFKVKECELELSKAEAQLMILREALKTEGVTVLERSVVACSKIECLKSQPEFLQARQFLVSLRVKELARAVECNNIDKLAFVINNASTILDQRPELLDAKRHLARLQIAKGVEEQDVELLEAVIQNTRAILCGSLEHLEAQRECAKLKLSIAVKSREISKLELAMQSTVSLLHGKPEFMNAQRHMALLVSQRALNVQHLLTQRMLQVTEAISSEYLSPSLLPQLASCMQMAVQYGINDAVIAMAHDIMESARSSGLAQCCAICLEVGKEARPLPCCGRTYSSNVLCHECATFLESNGSRCPFCRATCVSLAADDAEI